MTPTLVASYYAGPGPAAAAAGLRPSASTLVAFAAS